MLRTASISTTAPSRAAAPAARRSSRGQLQVRAAGLSKEQQEFMERKAREAAARQSAAPQPTRGRSSSSRPSARPTSARPSARPTSARPSSRPSSRPAPAPVSPPTPAYEPRVTDVEFARVALERTVTAETTTPHPRDPYPARPASPAPQSSGPSTGKWPEPAFFDEVVRDFPAKGVANAEEARALIDLGYKLLDVRSELESNARGKIRGSVPIPCAFDKQSYDAASGQMVTVSEDNPAFIAQVARKFPRKETPILVMDASGREYAIDVLEALDEEGYTNIVGLAGGYRAFTRSFDLKLNPKDGRPVMRRAMKKLL